MCYRPKGLQSQGQIQKAIQIHNRPQCLRKFPPFRFHLEVGILRSTSTVAASQAVSTESLRNIALCLNSFRALFVGYT